jgi:hypothetical protein
MTEEPQQTISQELVTSIVHLPRYLAQWVAGLIIVIFSESIVTTLAVTGVAVGFATSSILIGVASFFVLYSFARFVDMIARVIAQSSGRIVQVMYQAAAESQRGLIHPDSPQL